MSKVMEAEARLTYEWYLEEGLKMFPPFKGYGMKFVQFAMDHPDMYRELFFTPSTFNVDEYLDKLVQYEKIIPSVMDTMEINEKEAKWLFKNLLIYVHGLASMVSTKACSMSEKEISECLGSVCRGLAMQLKAPADERVKTMPGQDEKLAPKGINEYLTGKKSIIIGYGPNKEMYQIKLDAILYFEAVGENVFAYTKNNVYEMKQRLYKVEEQVKNSCFLRASKSLLVNQTKIASIASDTGGRGRINLLNGETVVANRAYYKSIVETLKHPV